RGRSRRGVARRGDASGREPGRPESRAGRGAAMVGRFAGLSPPGGAVCAGGDAGLSDRGDGRRQAARIPLGRARPRGVVRGAVDADSLHNGDFTPFGYLRNPGHRASSWRSVEGGNLRTAFDWVGVEWVYPLQRDPQASAGIRLETSTRRSRGDFAVVGLTSRYHSSNVLGFDWRGDGLDVAARFFLVDNDALAARVEVRNTTLEPRPPDIRPAQHAHGDLPRQHVLVASPEQPELLEPGARRLSWAVLARAATDRKSVV